MTSSGKTSSNAPTTYSGRIGVVTALIGVPFFLAMIFHERRALEDSPQ